MDWRRSLREFRELIGKAKPYRTERRQSRRGRRCQKGARSHLQYGANGIQEFLVSEGLGERHIGAERLR